MQEKLADGNITERLNSDLIDFLVKLICWELALLFVLYNAAIKFEREVIQQCADSREFIAAYCRIVEVSKGSASSDSPKDRSNSAFERILYGRF